MHRNLFIAVLLFSILQNFTSAQAIKPTCSINPSTPVAILAGGSYSFTASCGDGPLTWQSTGQGSIDSSGNYTAPASVRAQNQSRGCQELPNNSPFNVPVDSLPVDVHSSRWLNRVAQDGPQYLNLYHNLKFYPQLLSFYDNPVDNNARQQRMHFFAGYNSNGYQDTSFPIPAENGLMMEGGRSLDADSGYDRHLFTINKDNCTETEIYNLYVDFRTVSFTSGNPTRVTWTTNTVWPVPQQYSIYISGATGAWSAANGHWRLTLSGANSATLPFNSSSWGPAPTGTMMTSMPGGYACANCNSQSGQKFRPGSYAQQGGTDAAGMPISALSVKMGEWYAATRAGRSDLGHAIRTTMSNSYLSARYVWPATMSAYAVAGSPMQLNSATNGNPVVFTSGQNLSVSHPCDNYTYTAGCRFHVTISGLTGTWAAANGDQTATALDNYHFSINLNSTGWGAMPANGMFVFDFFPYGATVRLKASVDLDEICTSTDLNDWCPYAKIWLNTIKKYGLVVADGTMPADNWDNGMVASEFHPAQLIDAANHIRGAAALQPIENYLEVVDRSAQQMSNNLASYQMTNNNRTYVTVCGTSGCTTEDVLLQGTTIGTDRERLTIAAGVSYKLNVWVNGNVNPHVIYSIDNGIIGAYVSSSGLLTMPNCVTKQRGMVTVASAADPDALPLYVEVTCLPISADGSYRLALGNYSGDYRDTQNRTWWGSWANNGFDNYYEAPGLWFGGQLGSWQGLSACANDAWTGADSQLYSRSTSYNEDTMVDLIIPNGRYNVTLYGEPGFGGFHSNNTCGNSAGQNVYDWQVQGQTARSWVDGYLMAGNQPFHGYTLTTSTTVTDRTLNTVGRMRIGSTYGMSWSSLLIAPQRTPVFGHY